jgi:6-phosphogluconolactonase
MKRKASAPRWLLAGMLFLVPALLEADSGSPPGSEHPAALWAYIGTFTAKGSKGIYRFELDPASGKLTSQGLAGETTAPFFLALHPNHRFLYAVNEVNDFHGKKSGAVSAFAIDARTGKLTLLNQQPTGGAGPCHLVVDKQGKHLLVANYGGGSVCVLPIETDGRLGAATAFVQHQGTSVNPQRQEGPHAHCVLLDPANRFVLVADLGLDRILVYRYDAARGKLTPNNPPGVAAAPGAGPRHLAFHPNGRYVYAINEINSTMTAYAYDGDRGVLTPLQTVSTLPAGFTGNNSGAEVQVHPSGRFLYGSNRGCDSIAIFAIDPGTGKLRSVGQQGSHVKTPRNFAIDPTGTALVVANQDGDSLVVFRIDAGTGELRPSGPVVAAPMPVCVVLMPPPR